MSPHWLEFASWWLRLALAGGLMLLAGLALIAVCRQPIRRMRASAWTLAVALLLPALTLLPSWFTVHVNFKAAPLQARAVAAALDRPDEPAVEFADEEVVVRDDALAVKASPTPPKTPSGELAATIPTMRASETNLLAWMCQGLLVGYLLIGLIQLGRLAIGQWQLERLWRLGRPALLAARREFENLTQRFRCHPALRVSDRTAGPICFGVFRPRIVLPAVLAESADEQTLRWIFAHELSHLERRDPLIGWLLGLVQGLFFFWPWFWRLRREVRLNQEYLADAAAVRASASPHTIAPVEDYADFLVRLTASKTIPMSASGVKSRSSELYRRITMLLQQSGNVEARCPRRWSVAAGVGLLALGLILAGLHLSAQADPAPGDEKKAEPAQKESVEDIEKEVQKALDSLRKGPGAEPREEERRPAARNRADDGLRQAEDAMNKARKALVDNPASEENRKAFEDALRKYQDSFRNRQLPLFAAPGFAPINPADLNQDIGQLHLQFQQMMDDLHRQIQQFPQQPGVRGGRLALGGNNLGNTVRRLGDSRLGVRVERPNPVLAEQLDLPVNEGMVVMEVFPNTSADKAGIRVNDVLLEIGGKFVPSDAQELVKLVREFKGDTKVDITVLRKGKKETIKDVDLPEAKPPVAALPNKPGAPLPGLSRPKLRAPVAPPQALEGGNVDVRSTSVTLDDGAFTIKHSENGMQVTVAGSKEGDQVKPTSIVVEDNGKTVKADSLDKLDEQYRPTVEKLLKSIR